MPLETLSCQFTLFFIDCLLPPGGVSGNHDNSGQEGILMNSKMKIGPVCVEPSEGWGLSGHGLVSL